MSDDMAELRVRVSPIVKAKLERFKHKTGIPINYIVNWCLVKFMVLNKLLPPVVYDRLVKENENK
jgi:hypothetical protein